MVCLHRITSFLLFCPTDPTRMVYPYGITSLADKRDFLQKGDVVKFQLAVVKATGALRATRIAAVRKFQRSRVDSIKTQQNVNE